MNHSRRVLVFSLAYYPQFSNGAALFVKEIVERLSEKDMEFHVITLRTDRSFPKVEKIGNATIHRVGLGIRGFFPILASQKAKELHAQKKFDLVWGATNAFSGLAGLFFKLFNMQVPFVMTNQEEDLIDRFGKIIHPPKALVRMAFSHASMVHVTNERLLRKIKNTDTRRTVVLISKGVLIDMFATNVSSDRLQEIGKGLDRQPDDIFVSIGAEIDAHTSLTTCFEALTYLPKNVKLIVLGHVRREKTAVKRDLEKRVFFVEPFDSKSLAEFFKISHVFIELPLVRSSRYTIEAMASGLPVIASYDNGTAGIVKNKESGLLCDFTPEDVARKVEILLKDRGLREEIIDNAMHTIIDHYDWKFIAKEMKEKVFDAVFRQNS